jgi:RNA exonuclease 1
MSSLGSASSPYLHAMFSTFGLFQSLPCPQRNNCSRPSCIFAHTSDLPSNPTLNIPVQQPTPKSAVPSKRPFHNLAQTPTSSRNGTPSASASEPPTQRLKVGTAQKPAAVPATTHTSVCTHLHRFNTQNSRYVVRRTDP